jgi:hypothetical protein
LSRPTTRTPAIAVFHRALASKFSRSPTARSCSVDGSCVVSHYTGGRRQLKER